MFDESLFSTVLFHVPMRDASLHPPQAIRPGQTPPSFRREKWPSRVNTNASRVYTNAAMQWNDFFTDNP